MGKVIDRLKEMGYLKATYHAQKQIDEEAKTADFRIEIEPGALYKMGRLDIDGLDFESEPVIRKMWAMKPGDAYRAGYPEMFLTQVKQRGVLDYLGATHAETKVDDQQAVVDVRLSFKGGPQNLDSRPRDRKGNLEQQLPGPRAAE
jgi:outer membrane translocation and assembly module TamA